MCYNYFLQVEFIQNTFNPNITKSLTLVYYIVRVMLPI